MNEADVLKDVLTEEGFTPSDEGSSNGGNNDNGGQGNAGGGDNAADGDLIINEDDGGVGGQNDGGAGDGNANKNWKPSDAEWNQYLSEKFGRNADAILAELQEREHFKKLSEASPYKSALGGQLDELLAKGVSPDNAVRYLTLDPTKLGDKEIRAMVMGMERPDLKPDEISDLIDLNYGIGKHRKDEDSEKNGLLRLKYDVGADRAKFDELKKKLVEPSVNRDAVQSDFNNKQRIAQWKGHSEKIIKEFNALNIPVGLDKDGKPLKVVPYKIKDNALMEKLSKDLNTIIEKSPSLAADDKGIALVKEILEDRALKHLLPRIAHALIKTGASDRNGYWSKILHNTQLGDHKGAHDFSGGSANADDKFVDAIVAVETGRK